jgi:hypothetical protein
MEKDGNRDNFLDTFDEFCDFVELNDKFMGDLRKCRSFANNMKTVDVSYVRRLYSLIKC